MVTEQGNDDKIKRQQEKDVYVAECKKNNQDLSYEMLHFVNDSFGCENFSRDDNTNFWAKANELKEALKNSKLFRDDRDELWRKRQEACERVIYHNKRKQEIFISKSEDHRNTIINRAGLARVNNLFGFDPETVDSMKRCGKLIKEAWELLSYYKHEMTRQDKDKCFEYINDTQAEVNAWWDNYKGHNEYQHIEWRERTRVNINANRERLSKAEEALERVNDNISKIEGYIEEAKSDSFRDDAREWLDEAEAKARDIEASIERIQSWIDEDEAKLR